jgi:hypothetical protein
VHAIKISPALQTVKAQREFRGWVETRPPAVEVDVTTRTTLPQEGRVWTCGTSIGGCGPTWRTTMPWAPIKRWSQSSPHPRSLEPPSPKGIVAIARLRGLGHRYQRGVLMSRPVYSETKRRSRSASAGLRPSGRARKAKGRTRRSSQLRLRERLERPTQARELDGA